MKRKEIIELADDIRRHDERTDFTGFTRQQAEIMYKAYCYKTQGRRIDIGKFFDGLRVRPLMPGSMTTILAGTGTSKTWMLMHLARFFADQFTCLFELELEAEQLIERDLAIENKTHTEDVFRRTVTDESVTGFFDADDNLRIFDSSRMTVEDMELRILNVEKQTRRSVDIAMIDYMGLVSGTGRRYERATDNAQKIKRLAKTCKCAVVVVSQIGRNEKKDPYQPVTLFDAKDSGDIENSSSLVIGMWPNRDNPTTRRWVQVLKNNDYGPTIDPVEYEFDWSTSTFKRAIQKWDNIR